MKDEKFQLSTTLINSPKCIKILERQQSRLELSSNDRPSPLRADSFRNFKKKISKTREGKVVSRKVRTMLGVAAVIADFSPCNYPNAFQSGKRNLRRYCKRKTVDERYEATDCNVDKHSVGCCGAAEVVEGQREFGSMS